MTTAILVTAVTSLLAIEAMNGQFGLARPLVASTIIGLVLGDVTTGVIIGSTLQLIFMGISGVGAAVPPNQLFGAVIATTFAIEGGVSIELALGFAMPISIAGQAIEILKRTLTTALMHAADRAAASASYFKMEMAHYSGAILTIIATAVVIFPSVYFGVESVETLIAIIPTQVLRGLEVAGGILPVVGFGMLFAMLDIKKLVPFFYIGFALATFGGFSIIGVTMVSICIALLFDGFKKNSSSNHNDYDELDADMK